jgi:putative DNA primase/helicase
VSDGPGLIDFADLARALLQDAETLVSRWLPGGKKSGANYMCGGFDGGEGRSLGVNLNTGAWGEFAGDERGGDLISLYAAIHNLNQGQAARDLMEQLGWQRPGPARTARPSSAQTSAPSREPSSTDGRPQPPPDDPDAKPAKRKSLWRAVVPVPANAPPPDFKHWHYTEIAGSWEYSFEGKLYGHVVRFATSDGGKEILPHTWCVDESDGRGTMRWHWKQWDEPRPLYVPATLLSGDPSAVPVVLVEGEKCARLGHQLLGHEFDFVSWPGGSNAWAKASWGWLMGRSVYLWPDADAKRVRLTADERAANVDPASKPLLPEIKQPGMKAMVAIGSVLVADQGCTVYLCPVPTPENVATDGWDIADAIDGGWTADDVRAFIRGARVFVPPDDAARAKAVAGKSTPSLAGAKPGGESADDDEPDLRWRARLLTTQKGATLAVRDNLVTALDGIPTHGIPGIEEARGVMAFNEFTNDVIKLRETPWGTPAGVWDEVDELEMGNWLTREYWLPSMPRGTLEEAVLMVAKRHRYHPVRVRLERLRGTWDKSKRLGTWLRRACMVEDEIDEPTQEYLARVGTWLLMAMCARVLPERKEGSRIVCGPGTKFDYMTIFEGAQGAKKSTLASVLGWEYSADTGLVLGEKDSYQNLQGVWVYEWGELDSLNRSEVTRVKQFVSSPKDRFRASFDRRPKDYPRQVVFIGTTNEDHYLTDTTGNRRFWPVSVTREIDIAWVSQNIDQMFAEALVYVDAGERFYPTAKEQRELFDPQQNQRTVESAIDSEITRYLYDDEQHVPLGASNLALVDEVGLTELLKRIGYPVEKQTSVVMRAAGSVMRRLGWAVARPGAGGKPGRPRVYRRPKDKPSPLKGEPGGSNSSTRPTQGDSPAGADDDCPF